MTINSDIGIIGGGITGLVVAEYLNQKGMEFQLFEQGDQTGGNIKSEQFHGFTIEKGPNSLRLNDETYAFLEQIGLTESIKYASDSARFRYVLRDGSYRKLPTGLASFMTSSLFSLRTKINFAQDLFAAPYEASKESVYDFFEHKFGKEIADYVVTPFVNGIFAGDPKKLIINYSFPDLVRYAQSKGSLMRGAYKLAPKNTNKGIINLKNGLGSIPAKLEERHQSKIRLNTRVTSIVRMGNVWQLLSDEALLGTFKKIIICSPAYITSALLSPHFPEAAAAISLIPYNPISVTHTIYPPTSREWKGFGALHNRLEKSNSLGTIFSTSVFPSESNSGNILYTTFSSLPRGDFDSASYRKEIQKGVLADHKQFLGIKENPLHIKTTNYDKGIPQYTSDYEATIGVANELEKENIFLGGNWIGGISVPNCIQKGKEIATKL